MCPVRLRLGAPRAQPRPDAASHLNVSTSSPGKPYRDAFKQEVVQHMHEHWFSEHFGLGQSFLVGSHTSAFDPNLPFRKGRKPNADICRWQLTAKRSQLKAPWKSGVIQVFSSGSLISSYRTVQFLWNFSVQVHLSRALKSFISLPSISNSDGRDRVARLVTRRPPGAVTNLKQDCDIFFQPAYQVPRHG